MNWSESMPFVRSKLTGSIQEDQVDGGKHEYWASIFLMGSFPDLRSP